MKTTNGRSKGAGYWRNLLAECKSSGLSIQDFCKQKGIVQSSFYNWKKRLSDKPSLIELPIRKILKQHKESGNIFLSYNNFEIELSHNFSGESVSKLLNILKGI
jgi:hypothetical protein